MVASAGIPVGVGRDGGENGSFDDEEKAVRSNSWYRTQVFQRLRRMRPRKEDVTGRMIVVVATAAGLVATIYQRRDVIAETMIDHLDLMAGRLFIALQTDIVGFALPAAYFRFAVPAMGVEESMLGKVVAAMFVGIIALANLWWIEGECCLSDFASLFGAIVASYAFVIGRPKGLQAAATMAFLSAAGSALVIHLRCVFLSTRFAFGVAFVVGGQRLCSQLLTKQILGPWAVNSRRCLLVVCFCLGALGVLPLMHATFRFLLPVDELTQAYGMIARIVGERRLETMSTKLLVVAAFCQVSLGYLGIAFLRRGQERKNSLLSVGDGKIPARNFARVVWIYMLTAALPYMVQRTIMENVHNYVYGRFARNVERSLRLATFFPEGGDTLLASVQGSKFTVEGYTDAYNAIVEVIHSTVESKLFALPKLILLPGMLVKQPWLVVSVLPASVALEMGRARMVATMTKRLEKISRDIKDLANQRRKIEQHDAKNEELIRRGSSSRFVASKWMALAVEIEEKTLRFHALASFRGFVNFLYKQDLLGPGIELVLAWLLEFRNILSADIWVYTRVVEDSIDLLLTRFRMDATLASMATNMDRLSDLVTRLDDTRARGRASCSVDSAAGDIRIEDLDYMRGSSEVRIPELVLKSGRVYAVTGANGSGKSSFFGIIAGCGTRGTMLPEGLTIRGLKRLVVPSDELVEITQSLYCPLFTKPIDWLLQRKSETLTTEELASYEKHIGELTEELEFRSHRDEKVVNTSGVEPGLTSEELHEDHDDWYSTLSGGQKGKLEFISKVFVKDRCPGVMLIDEAFAPLDPRSKSLVQKKLKEFCKNSVILVIYHSDANEDCVTSGGFFDNNLHFANRSATLLGTCSR
eukprot:TRINITY_DN9305_c0_g1_i1.p1 TRINITY_DN9305_c0_g1~~TRINITY_DN9305_c0_g1_i1.p1  ORF type:complete len:868 (+),score=123.04 TRINITY_DN9305_c0_g1_i1:152-2755(+)